MFAGSCDVSVATGRIPGSGCAAMVITTGQSRWPGARRTASTISSVCRAIGHSTLRIPTKWAGRTDLKWATAYDAKRAALYRSEAGHLRGPCLGRGGQFIEWCLRSSVECGSASFAKAFSAKIDAIGVVNDAVQNRVG